MALQMIIFLFGLVSQVLCIPGAFEYTENCKPPPGMNDTGLTTPGYDTLKPIERCCPQCDLCKHKGGFCALKWAIELYKQCCDFAPAAPCRDYACECCIKCGDDKCSPCIETGGECRKECRPGELEDKTHQCSYYNNGDGCKCCKKCEAQYECTDAEGTCLTNPNDCPHGTFASTGCCGGCYCCKPILEPINGTNCEISGGYCSETDECANGYYACFGECSKTTFNGGLQSIELGYCCIPKQTANTRFEALPFLMNQQEQDTRKHPRQLFL